MNQLFNYNVNITWLESRKGIMESNVLSDRIEVATPPEFTKGIPGIWSPEHLFVAAAGSCFMTTFLAVAEKSRLKFDSFSCNASGILEKREQGMMITNITLRPIVNVSNQDMLNKALKVLELSHQSCLILNSIKSEILFMPRVELKGNLHSGIL